MKLKSFNEFITEKKEEDFEDKIKGHGYFKGISTSTARKKTAQMKKQADMADDDPNAYKPLPGDTKGKKLLKKSKFTKAYDELYGDDESNESLTEGKMPDKFIGNDEIVFLKTKEDSKGANYNLYYKGHDIDGGYRFGSEKELKDFADDYILSNQWYNKLKYEKPKPLPESVNEEQKQSTDRSPIDNEAIETGLKNKSKETGVPIGILRAVMRRGMAAWKTGHRPGAGQEQWGYARVNSFLTKGDGTWGKADADLAKEVRDGGHDKKLKKG
jgi:hypothetical protein